MEDQTKTQPDLYAYAVRESENGKSYFTKIGAAFAHVNGSGYTIDLSAYPVDNKIVLFPPKEDELSAPTKL